MNPSDLCDLWEVIQMRVDLADRFSLNQVANQSGVHVATTWRWALQGGNGRRLRTISIGGRRFVLPADLDAFLAQEDAPRRDGDADFRRRAVGAGKVLDGLGVGFPAKHQQATSTPKSTAPP